MLHRWPYFRPFLRLLVPALVLIVSMPVPADAASCAPPPGFVDTPAPAVASGDRLVARTETIEIERNLTVVLAAADKPLKDVVHQTSSLPGVAGDYPLTQGGFGLPGARRMVCLTDGSTLEEQVLERERKDTSYRFRYEVWNYTSKQARPIVYGLGDFLFSEIGPGRTRIVWTYSFALNRHRFPGYLGAVGDFMFRIGFLDRQYADLMRDTLCGYKTAAESERADRARNGSTSH